MEKHLIINRLHKKIPQKNYYIKKLSIIFTLKDLKKF